jgi:hypothetical protein
MTSYGCVGGTAGTVRGPGTYIVSDFLCAEDPYCGYDSDTWYSYQCLTGASCNYLQQWLLIFWEHIVHVLSWKQTHYVLPKHYTHVPELTFIMHTKQSDVILLTLSDSGEDRNWGALVTSMMLSRAYAVLTSLGIYERIRWIMLDSKFLDRCRQGPHNCYFLINWVA